MTVSVEGLLGELLVAVREVGAKIDTATREITAGLTELEIELSAASEFLRLDEEDQRELRLSFGDRWGSPIWFDDWSRLEADLEKDFHKMTTFRERDHVLRGANLVQARLYIEVLSTWVDFDLGEGFTIGEWFRAMVEALPVAERKNCVETGEPDAPSVLSGDRHWWWDQP